MKVIIIYASNHHGNTKKLTEGIVKNEKIDLIDVLKAQDTDLSNYDVIGLASGIYFSKYHESILKFAREKLPEGKKVFFLYTAADPHSKHIRAIKEITDYKQCKYLGRYCCKGWDSYGPFKLIGGIWKKHPNQKEIDKAIEFYHSLQIDKTEQ